MYIIQAQEALILFMMFRIPKQPVTARKEMVHLFIRLATGAWRAPNNNTNTFARESQIDIMASTAGIDPLEFRLKNLKDEKMIACLKAVQINSVMLLAKLRAAEVLVSALVLMQAHGLLIWLKLRSIKTQEGSGCTDCMCTGYGIMC